MPAERGSGQCPAGRVAAGTLVASLPSPCQAPGPGLCSWARPVCCSPLCKARFWVCGKESVLGKRTVRPSERGGLPGITLLGINFFAFFYLNANMTSCPFIFYAALVFPIPSALEAAEGMQFLFSFAEEMMIPVPWKMFSLDGWGVCMCEVPKAAREGPFPISDSLAIKQPL